MRRSAATTRAVIDALAGKVPPRLREGFVQLDSFSYRLSVPSLPPWGACRAWDTTSSPDYLGKHESVTSAMAETSRVGVAGCGAA